MSPRRFHHFEEGIGPQRAVRPQGYAVPVRIAITRQLRGIDHVQRDVLGVVKIDALVENHHVAAAARAGRIGRIKDGAIVADVVEQACAYGRTAGHKRKKAGK